MNELKKLNKNSSISERRKLKKSKKKKLFADQPKKKIFLRKRKGKSKILLLYFAFISLILLIIFLVIKKMAIKMNFLNNNYNNQNLVFNEKYILKKEENSEEDTLCNKYDPINSFYYRLINNSKTICENGDSKHICYQNTDPVYNDIYWYKEGVACIMKNIILDPSKSNPNQYVFNGPVDWTHNGFPLTSYGLFNMKCESLNKLERYHQIYNFYFDSWNYKYQGEGENIEELAPGKTIFFISRNQDSPNLFHGGSEVINTLAMMELFSLKPEDVQIVFLDSITLKHEFDTFIDIYKNIISRGGEPLYIKNLKKKYLISSAIHIPLLWDTPCFFHGGRDVVKEFPKCKNPTRTYKIYNDLINKYMKIPDYKDSFVSDNEVFYYPKSVIENHKSNNKFEKYVTIQWRKAWPKVRKKQARILAKGPEIADKLASILPKNFLIRLIDTGGMSMIDQMSLMKNTDYLVGIHGAGLALVIFMPYGSIMHEVGYEKHLIDFQIMSPLSGHKTYYDNIQAEVKEIDGNENVFFNVDEFGEKVLKRMKESNFIS